MVICKSPSDGDKLGEMANLFKGSEDFRMKVTNIYDGKAHITIPPPLLEKCLEINPDFVPEVVIKGNWEIAKIAIEGATINKVALVERRSTGGKYKMGGGRPFDDHVVKWIRFS